MKSLAIIAVALSASTAAAEDWAGRALTSPGYHAHGRPEKAENFRPLSDHRRRTPANPRDRRKAKVVVVRVHERPKALHIEGCLGRKLEGIGAPSHDEAKAVSTAISDWRTRVLYHHGMVWMDDRRAAAMEVTCTLASTGERAADRAAAAIGMGELRQCRVVAEPCRPIPQIEGTR